ncbi:MAG: hypothetical protein OXE92_08740 [Bacteroidetes bacterium]|nr:hypothetical protein [Bacteroidota bacterium]
MHFELSGCTMNLDILGYFVLVTTAKTFFVVVLFMLLTWVM